MNGFKYIAKKKIGKTYRYFYSQEELKAFLNVGDPESKAVGLSSIDAYRLSKDPSKSKAESVGVTNASGANRVLNKLKDISNKFQNTKAASKLSDAKKFADKGKGIAKEKIKDVSYLMDSRKYDIPMFNKLSEVPKKIKNYTKNEDTAATNPFYSPSNYAFSNNCAYCTASYDMRQRGYEVEANGVTYATCNTEDEIMSWYKNPELKNLSKFLKFRQDSTMMGC